MGNKIRRHKLEECQRRSANALEEEVICDPLSAAYEIIWLRDQLALAIVDAGNLETERNHAIRCKRKGCKRLADGYCAQCHQEMHP